MRASGRGPAFTLGAASGEVRRCALHLCQRSAGRTSRKTGWTLSPVALTLLVAALTTAIPPARADLPPWAYARMQEAAPEVLTIEVKSVRTGICFLWCDGPKVILTARVLEVTRSASGLTPGDDIAIRYRRVELPNGWSGPRPIPVPSAGDRLPAWLVAEAGHYTPAAEGFSFERVDRR